MSSSAVNTVNTTMTQSINNKINNILQSNEDLKTENKVYTGILMTCIILLLFYCFTYFIVYKILFNVFIKKDNGIYQYKFNGNTNLFGFIKKSYQFWLFILFCIFSVVIFGTCVVFNKLVFPNIQIDVNNTATTSFVSYLFIVGFTMMTIHFVAPGLITIFENTIGYGFLNIFFPESLNETINKPDGEINKELFKGNFYSDGRNVVENTTNMKLPNTIITNPTYGMNISLDQRRFTPPTVGGNSLKDSKVTTGGNPLFGEIISNTNIPSVTLPDTYSTNKTGILFGNIINGHATNTTTTYTNEKNGNTTDANEKNGNTTYTTKTDETNEKDATTTYTNETDTTYTTKTDETNEKDTTIKKDKTAPATTAKKLEEILLGDFILRKHLIGHMCWMYLSSITAFLTSISAYGVYALDGTNV